MSGTLFTNLGAGLADRIERTIGGGGMSRVFVADEIAVVAD